MISKNIAANYLSFIIVSVITFVFGPKYIQYLGVESYGIVGFFTMLQGWFNILDLGLTPTISRESSRFNAGTLDAISFRKIFKSISIVFVLTAVIGGSTLFYLSEFIANNWLKSSPSLFEYIVQAVKIMALSISLKWIGGLFKGLITGMEHFVWLSAFSVFFALLRFCGVIVALKYWGSTLSVFFIYQLVILIFEFIVLAFKANSLLPVVKDFNIGWSFKPILPLLKFSLSIAFTSTVWVIVTQLDKLMLSGILTLKDYGYFTLAITISSAVTAIGGPISNVLMPRMSVLYSQGDEKKLLQLYSKSTRIVTSLTFAVALIFSFFPDSTIRIWTNDEEIIKNVSPILVFYSLGNVVLSAAAFPYYLQYSKGQLKYHIKGNFIMLFILIPSIVFSSIFFGGVGAGIAWMLINLIYLLFWVSYTHKMIQPGIHNNWILKDVLFNILPMFLFVFCFKLICQYYNVEILSIYLLLTLGAVTLMTSSLSLSYLYSYIKKIF